MYLTALRLTKCTMPFWPKSHSFGFTTSLSWFFSHPPTPFGLCYKLGKFGLCTAATLTCHIRIPCNNRDCKYDITAMLHYQCYKLGEFRACTATTPTCHIQVPSNSLDCQYDITVTLSASFLPPTKLWTASLTLQQCYTVSILSFPCQSNSIWESGLFPPGSALTCQCPPVF